MAQFSLQGRLKLLMNNDGTIIKGKTLDKCKSNKASGLLGFGDFCSIFPVHFIENDVRRNGYSRKVRVLASKRSSSGSTGSSSNSSKSVNGNIESRHSLRDEAFDALYELEDDEDDLSCFRGLVLDISYRPVNVVCWKRAICLEFMEKADVLEYYDQTVSSPSGSFNIPAVLRVPHLLQVVKRKRVRNTLSRKNILHRDDYVCQYCYATKDLTIDHVVPISRGGKWEWENLVTACAKCNSKKGQKTLEEANMSLIKVPKAPKEYDILAIPLTSAAVRMLKLRKGTPEEWRQYLPHS